MEKSYLEKTEEKFYESLETITKPEEKFKRYSDFWNWLEYQEAEQIKARLIYNVVTWVNNTDTIVKNFTTKWNSKLVKRTGLYVTKFKEIVQMGEEDIVEQTSLFSRIINEPDFATMVYCCLILQQGGVVKFNGLFKDRSEEKIIVTEPTLLENDQ